MTRSQKKQQLYTLTDFDVQEVSLVDHAANQHRFLVAKRRETVTATAKSSTDPGNSPHPGGAANTDTEPGGDTGSVDTEGLLRQALDGLQVLQESVAALKQPITPPAPAPDVTVASGEPTEVTKALQQRLARLEKQFGLPNSASPEPAVRKRKHSWPYDINRPVEDSEDDDIRDEE